MFSLKKMLLTGAILGLGFSAFTVHADMDEEILLAEDHYKLVRKVSSGFSST